MTTKRKNKAATKDKPVVIQTWPQQWRHKKSKKLVRATPWWEIPEPVVSDDGASGSIDVGTAPVSDGRKFRIGVLVQVGWLLENEHGMWLGVGPKAEDMFEVVDSAK